MLLVTAYKIIGDNPRLHGKRCLKINDDDDDDDESTNNATDINFST